MWYSVKKPGLYHKPGELLTNVISRDAAAALMWRLGCLTELEQSKARANVPTDLDITRNWSICLSVRWCDGVQTKVSKSSRFRLSASSEMQNTNMNTEGTTHHSTIKHIYCTCKNYMVRMTCRLLKLTVANISLTFIRYEDGTYRHWQKLTYFTLIKDRTILHGGKASCNLERNSMQIYIPYVLESNPHPFYSFRGLKNQMPISIMCGLDSRSRAGFWKNDRAAVRAARTIQ